MSDVLKIINDLENYKQTHKLNFYRPYEYQKNFHNAKGFKTDRPARQRALMAANQVGKTTCGAYEIAIHATGQYPEWWKGTRFNHPTEWLVSSNTNEATRDRCQKDLFGEPTDDKLIGTGTIPIENIGQKIRKPGVPDAYDSVLVKHTPTGGWSKIVFRAYEQGPKKFMGSRLTGGFWGDEEPPSEIWSQMVRGTFATNGIGLLTFTPEEGLTEVVVQFMQDLHEGQCLIRASWDDAPHMTPEKREMALAGIPAHEREMRSKGEPLMGTGRVFPLMEDQIMIEPFEIPNHFPRLNGLDFGYDHPFACAFTAWDREKDVFYVYDGYKESRALIPVHSKAIKSRGDWIPCSWPHDGLKHEPKSGKVMADLYRDEGINMFPSHFTNPPGPWEEEGKGGYAVEPGVLSMLEAMETGRFFVFKNVKPFWDEFSTYHRKDGKIVPFNDDFISAVRYAYQFRRHAQVKIVKQPKIYIAQGASNW